MTSANRANTVKTASFDQEDYETLYWVVVDFLHAKTPLPAARRKELKELATRLSAFVLAKRGRAESGVIAIRRPSYIDIVRRKLLKGRNPAEYGTWAIYAEGIEDDPQGILLAIVEGTYITAVERALSEPGFITKGMGGQIDPLGG